MVPTATNENAETDQSNQRPWLISQALAQGLFKDAPTSYPAYSIPRHGPARLPNWLELLPPKQDA